MSRHGESSEDENHSSAMRVEMTALAKSLWTWVLYALVLVSLHVLQFVVLQAPWIEGSGNVQPVVVRSGWEIAGTDGPGRSLVALSVLVLVVSTLATLEALRRRNPWIFAIVALLSIGRLVTVAIAVSAVEADDTFWFTRYGEALTVWMLVLTVIVAVVAVRRSRSS